MKEYKLFLMVLREQAQKNIKRGTIDIYSPLDGKILCETLKHARDDQPSVHLLSFYTCESGRILDQFLVPKERNEESAWKAPVHPFLVCRLDVRQERMMCNNSCISRVLYGTNRREEASDSTRE
jgi:hypothetical protein